MSSQDKDLGSVIYIKVPKFSLQPGALCHACQVPVGNATGVAYSVFYENKKQLLLMNCSRYPHDLGPAQRGAGLRGLTELPSSLMPGLAPSRPAARAAGQAIPKRRNRRGPDASRSGVNPRRSGRGARCLRQHRTARPPQPLPRPRPALARVRYRPRNGGRGPRDGAGGGGRCAVSPAVVAGVESEVRAAVFPQAAVPEKGDAPGGGSCAAASLPLLEALLAWAVRGELVFFFSCDM